MKGFPRPSPTLSYHNPWPNLSRKTWGCRLFGSLPWSWWCCSSGSRVVCSVPIRRHVLSESEYFRWSATVWRAFQNLCTSFLCMANVARFVLPSRVFYWPKMSKALPPSIAFWNVEGTPLDTRGADAALWRWWLSLCMELILLLPIQRIPSLTLALALSATLLPLLSS